MTIKQILYKDIPRTIYRKGWSLSFPGGTKDIYFKLEEDLIDQELWEVVRNIKDFPSGVIDIHALGQYNYFRVTYFPNQITEEDVLNYLENNKILIRTQTN